MSLKEEILNLLDTLGSQSKRALGQNFLIDERIISHIIETAKGFAPKQIVEIGPGLGSLTKSLRGICPRLKLLELDRTICEHWRSEGYDLVEGDALEFPWSTLDSPETTLLVSNLPYQISSRILIDRCLDARPLLGMVLMFQREVTERILARPKTKDYGLLSVMSQLFWDIDRVVNVSPGSFYPPPKIQSRVLKFHRNIHMPPGLREQSRPFFEFLKLCFHQRRKLLANNLSSLISPELLRPILEELGHNTTARAEELSPIDFWSLYSLPAFKKNHPKPLQTWVKGSLKPG